MLPCLASAASTCGLPCAKAASTHGLPCASAASTRCLPCAHVYLSPSCTSQGDKWCFQIFPVFSHCYTFLKKLRACTVQRIIADLQSACDVGKQAHSDWRPYTDSIRRRCDIRTDWVKSALRLGSLHQGRQLSDWSDFYSEGSGFASDQNLNPCLPDSKAEPLVGDRISWITE